MDDKKFVFCVATRSLPTDIQRIIWDMVKPRYSKRLTRLMDNWKKRALKRMYIY